MRHGYGVLAMGVALSLAVGTAEGQVGVDQDGIDHFHMAVGDVYGTPVGPVPSYIHEDELPVVYLLAREAGVSPEVVMALREQGWSWLDITNHLGVDPYVYVARLPRHHGYWGWPSHRSYVYLTDRHIIDYVNLVFWATYHRRPVTQIIVIRQRVPSWKYYVRYHAPRVVVYRSAPVRQSPPVRRTQPPQTRPPVRRAQPRAEVPARSPARATPTRPAQQTRPAATRPPSRPAAQQTRPTPSRPTAQPSRPAAQQTRPTPSRPAAQPSRPAAQQTRPTPSRPAAQPSRPAAQRSRPAPSRPTAQPSRPAAQRSRPAAQQSRPAAQQSRPSATRSRPTATQRPSARSATRARPRD